MQQGSESKTIPLPKFDAKDKHFTSWWTRFEAYADFNGFGEALHRGEDPDLPASDSATVDVSTDAGKMQMRAKRRNKLAMANLTMAFSTDGLLNLIHKAKTTDWPKGLAYLVVEAVHNKYQPKDTINLVEARLELNKVKIKKDENPAKLFELLSGIENKYNQESVIVDEADLIATVLYVAPSQYQSVLATKQEIRGNALTLRDLETTMSKYWRQTKGSRAADQNEEEDMEVSLAVTSGNNRRGTRRRFTGKCFNCGAIGHIASGNRKYCRKY